MNFDNTATTGASGFSFGSANTSTFGSTGGGDAGKKSTDVQVTKSFGIGVTAPPVAKSASSQVFNFGVQGSGPKPTVTPSIATSDTSKIFFGTTPISSAGFINQLNVTSAITAPSTVSQKNVGTTNLNLSTSTNTTESSVPTHSNQFSFGQLEEHINKWTLELEEQEKIFTNQATQINAWDNLLISNNDKIVALNDAAQKVKTEQQTLEQELEFIATQHAELEESITPLQKDLQNIPQVDVERTQTYLLVENLDTQLKQMSEDLKEVIDYLNEANKSQDNTDPIVQIGKILSAHMSSLQWIESSSSIISAKLDEISTMHESLRRDSERSFRLTYYD